MDTLLSPSILHKIIIHLIEFTSKYSFHNLLITTEILRCSGAIAQVAEYPT
jgi:hypothetical protein